MPTMGDPGPAIVVRDSFDGPLRARAGSASRSSRSLPRSASVSCNSSILQVVARNVATWPSMYMPRRLCSASLTGTHCDWSAEEGAEGR